MATQSSDKIPAASKEYLDSYSARNSRTTTTPRAAKKILRPQSAPYKMFQRYQQESRAASSRASSAAVTSAAAASRRRHVESAPLIGTDRPSSRVRQDYHRARCAQPQPHDLDSANTFSAINGPNASTDSLLWPPHNRAPSRAQSARASQQRQQQHTSAWYHVPGRYVTSERPYPPKRSQQRIHDAHRKLVRNLHTKSHSKLLITSTFPTYIRNDPV